MKKRPVVFIVLAYILGLMCAGYNQFFVLFIMATIQFIMIIVSAKKAYYGKWLLLLPIICFLANMLMIKATTPKNIEQAFEDKTYVTLQAKVIDVANDKKSITIKSDNIILNNKIYNESYKLITYLEDESNVRIGNTIEIEGTLKKFQTPGNPGEFDESIYYKIKGIDYKIYSKQLSIVDYKYNKSLHMLKEINYKLDKLYKTLLPEKESSIINSMILGNKSQLDVTIRDLYQKNGIAHILAISGLHISLIGFTLYNLLRKVFSSIKISSIITMIILILYCILTGASTSTKRAVFMIIILLIAGVIGRTYDALTAISVSALIILVINPLQLFDIGFQLSYGAVIGITILIPFFHKLIPYKNKILDLFYASISATLVTLPLILYYFYEFPTYSIIINMIVVPLMSLLVPVAVLGGILGIFNMFAGRFIIGTAYYILQVYENTCLVFNKVPYSNITTGRPSLFFIIIYYFIIIGIIIYFDKKHKKLLYLTLIIASVTITISVFKPKQLLITFIDIGQGDSIFIQTPSDKTYLIDGGNKNMGKNKIYPYLKYQGIDRLDCIIMTHSDGDHVLGLMEVIESMTVNTIIVPTTNLTDELYNDLIKLANRKDIRVLEFKKGDKIIDDEVNISCLHPSEDYFAKKNNDYSLVLGLEYNNFNLLLTGDIEQKQESVLSSELYRYIGIKVPHHGSKTSSSKEFLDSIFPQIAVISSGKNNMYGHPHKEVIDTYNNYDTIIINTAQSGAVNIRTNGKSIYLTAYREKGNLYAKNKRRY